MFVQVDVYSTNRKLFIFQTVPPNLGTARFHLGLASCPESMATGLGEGASLEVFVPRPHPAFSLCPQPVSTESAPKNVVDTVSDSGRQGWVPGSSLGGRKVEDGFGESDQMCVGTSFWSRYRELGGSGGAMGDVGSRCIWKWVAGELGRPNRRGRGGSREREASGEMWVSLLNM